MWLCKVVIHALWWYRDDIQILGHFSMSVCLYVCLCVQIGTISNIWQCPVISIMRLFSILPCWAKLPCQRFDFDTTLCPPEVLVTRVDLVRKSDLLKLCIISLTTQLQGGASARKPGLGWYRFGMFQCPARAVGTYGSSPPARELPKSESTQPRFASRCATLHVSAKLWLH